MPPPPTPLEGPHSFLALKGTKWDVDFKPNLLMPTKDTQKIKGESVESICLHQTST